MDLVQQMHVCLRPALFCFRFDPGEQFLCIREELTDGVRVRRMERQGDHRLNIGQIDLDHAVIIRAVGRVQGLVGLRTAVDLKEALRLLVRLPDGGQAGGLGRHDVDAVAEIDRERRNAGACKLQHAVFDKAAGERLP